MSPIFVHCWTVPNLTILLSHILSYYLAEIFPILKHCWCVPYLCTLQRSSQSWNTADVYPDLLHCWAVPNLKTLLTYTLCYYMAELYPILVHCRTRVYLNTLLSVSRNVVRSQSESSITSSKNPESCRLGCRFLWFMIGHSESTMLHRLLSVTTVKIVCCHIAFLTHWETIWRVAGFSCTSGD